jgi:hypothetical protein
MTQEEYNKAKADDELIKSIDGIDEHVENIDENGGDGSNDDLQSIVQGAMLAITEALKEVQSSMQHVDLVLSDLITTTSNYLYSIAESSKNTELYTHDMVDQAIDTATGETTIKKEVEVKTTGANSADFLTSALKLCEAIIDDKKAAAFKANSKLYATGIEMLVKPVEMLLEVADKANDAAGTMNSLAAVINGIGNAVLKISASLVLIAGTMLALTVALNNIGWDAVGNFMIKFPLMCTALAVGLAIMKKAVDKQAMDAALGLAVAVGIMSVAMIAFNFIDTEAVVKGVGAMLVLAGGLALIMRFMPTKQIAEFSKSMLWFVGGVMLMAGGIILLSKVVETIKPKQLLASLAMVAGAALILAVVGHLMKDTGRELGIASLLIVASVALLIATAYVLQDVIDDIRWETWAAMGATLLVLVGAVWAIGKSKATWQGVAALGAIAASLMIVALAAKMYESIEWETMGKMGATVAVLTGAVLLLGLATPVWAGVAMLLAISVAMLMIAAVADKFAQTEWETLGKMGAAVGGLTAVMVLAGLASVPSLLGAVALIAGAGALMLLANALIKWPTSLGIDDYENIGTAVRTVSDAMMYIGMPWRLPMILAGIAEAAGLGLAINSLARGLAEAQKVNFSVATEQATGIVVWARDTLKTIGSLSLKEAMKAGFGLKPFKDLGEALANLAIGITTMANGVWTEYDEAGKEIGKHNVGPAQYAAFGDAVAQMVDAITVPLQNFGAGGGFLRSSDAEKGLDALSGIGDIVGPMIDVARESDNVAKANYTGFATGLENLVNGIHGPISKLGAESGGWFSNSDFESGMKMLKNLGEVTGPVVEVAKEFGALDPNADTAGKFKNVLDVVISSITDYALATANVSDANGAFASQMTEIAKATNSMNIENLQALAETGKVIDTIANTDLSKLTKVKNDLKADVLSKLDEVKHLLQTVAANTAVVPYDPKADEIEEVTDINKEELSVPELIMYSIYEKLDDIYNITTARR